MYGTGVLKISLKNLLSFLSSQERHEMVKMTFPLTCFKIRKCSTHIYKQILSISNLRYESSDAHLHSELCE